MSRATVIETRKVVREYGFAGVEAIVDHPEHGLILVTDGYGGEDTPMGGAVRWTHGRVAKLLPGDTLAALDSTDWNYCTSSLSAVLLGLDCTRPLIDTHPRQIAQGAGI